MKQINANLLNFHKSIGEELQVIKNRVRDLIGDAHWQKEGEYKEAILRSCINRFLPPQYSLGTGFVLIKEDDRELVTSQIDIIVYDNSHPILFKEGDFVIVLPQSVRGIIEVKTKITTSKFAETVGLINANARMIYKKKKESDNLDRSETTSTELDHLLFVGLFSYDCDDDENSYLSDIKGLFIQHKSTEDNLVFVDKCKCFINNFSLSDQFFLGILRTKYHGVKWDEFSYGLWDIADGLSKSFFVTQLLWYLEPLSMRDNSEIWTSPCRQRLIEKIEAKDGVGNPYLKQRDSRG